jgi:hypothetical protein
MPEDRPDAARAASVTNLQGECPKNPPPEDGKRVRRRDLLNLLNFINFREGTIFVSFKNLERGDRVSYQAFPMPCLDESLDCRWLPPGIPARHMDAYEFESILLSDGRSHVTVKAELLSLDSAGIALRIPESGYEKGIRTMDRYACEGIAARMIQAGMCFEGELADFNSVSYRVALCDGTGASLRWLNPDEPVTVLFSKGGDLLYSGECMVTRMDRGRSAREMVLAPNFSGIRRYKNREFRGQRHVLSPAPAARFKHPFTGKPVFLQAVDISGAGIRVEEFFERSLLVPGMVIPEMAIEIANNFIFNCRAQVLYRNVVRDEDGRCTVTCGVVFLDMAAEDQARLSAFIHQSVDERLRICGSVDMDELWRFFFESGFIYPSKYLSIQTRKEEFKRTYERLYLESPSIARHFIFQDKGQIFGHMSMIRCYSNSWMIHHHAASRSGYGLAGVSVLDEVGRFGNEFYHHPSAHIDYLMCYYRRENRFPSRVFGGVVRDISNPKGSSNDAFAYLRLPAEPGAEDAAFQLFPARSEDLAEARRRYEGASGGLAFDALDLREDAELKADRELSGEYRAQGFKRERVIFCMRSEGRLQALIALALSDLGLNLSNLTNCAHVFVLDPKLRPKALFSGLRVLLRQYAAEDIPILAYPAEYLDEQGLRYEKKYLLWVLDMDYADAYFSSLRNTFRRASRDGDGHAEIE